VGAPIETYEAEVLDPSEEVIVQAGVEAEERTALVALDPEAGTLALAAMSEEQFEARIVQLKAGRQRIARIQQELLRPDVDYGLIPGTQKPTLLKPGAEKLCDFYRYAADFEPTVEYSEVGPPIRVLMRCRLHLGSLDGPVVAIGYGEANSWEKRYRYRSGGLTCPKCGAVGSLTTGPTSRGSHWCIPDKGGCGQNISVEDAKNAERVEKVENPDPYDLANTLVKMAEKRAHIDATLRATATSGLFTQDVEDQPRPAQRATTAGTEDMAETATEASGSFGDGLPEMGEGEPVVDLIARDQREGMCPIHHKPWSQKNSTNGSFWACGTKTGDVWCKERPSEWWKARHEV
jgi:hypothetical protein